MLDKDILQLLHTNVNAGYMELVIQYRYVLWNVCARHLQNTEDIQECIFAALADFCMHLDHYQPEKGTLKNYLAAIAERKALDKYRQNFRWNRANEAVIHSQEQADSLSVWNEAWDMLNELSELDARILRMHYFQNIRYAEIAQILGMNYEAVKKRGGRALQKLRAMKKE